MGKEDYPRIIETRRALVINLPINFARSCYNRRLDYDLRRSFRLEAVDLIRDSKVEVNQIFSAYNFLTGIKLTRLTCLLAGCSIPGENLGLLVSPDFLQKLQADNTLYLNYRFRVGLGNKERDLLERLYNDWFDTMNSLLQK